MAEAKEIIWRSAFVKKALQSCADSKIKITIHLAFDELIVVDEVIIKESDIVVAIVTKGNDTRSHIFHIDQIKRIEIDTSSLDKSDFGFKSTK